MDLIYQTLNLITDKPTKTRLLISSPTHSTSPALSLSLSLACTPLGLLSLTLCPFGLSRFSFSLHPHFLLSQYIECKYQHHGSGFTTTASSTTRPDDALFLSCYWHRYLFKKSILHHQPVLYINIDICLKNQLLLFTAANARILVVLSIFVILNLILGRNMKTIIVM